MSIQVVRAALETRLTNWAIAQSPPLQIAYENVPFNKPDTPYLECFLIPNKTLNRQVDGLSKTLLGLFQVNVWTPGGAGRGQAESIAEGIVKLFPVSPKFSSVSVEQTPSTSRPLSDTSGWTLTPVLIMYRYESSV